MFKNIFYVSILFMPLSAKSDIDKVYAPKKEVVRAAEEVAYPDFPTKKDILGVIGVESEFDPKITTGTSIGLMQVCYKSHAIAPQSLFNVRFNIKKGSQILRDYYISLGRDRAAALMAYNLGINAYRQGKRRYSYVRRVDSVKKLVSLK